MSYLNFVEELFLGKIELTRFQEFMKDSGFQKFILKIGSEFGLIDSLVNSFNNGLIQAGTTAGTIKINDIFAIDKDGLFLSRNLVDNISIPDNNNWYWVKIYHSYFTQEIGTVNIDQFGKLIGTGTEFLKIFRGQPDFPTKIKFLNSINNLLEYEVLDIINDTNAILQGNFITETNLNFSIVGTFTEGSLPLTINKYPFKYDLATIELIQSILIPTYILGKEFFLGRVKWDSGTGILDIEDKRSSFRFKLQSDYYLNQLPLKQNPLIGIEEIKFDSTLSPRDKNIIYISWGLRTSSYTFDSKTNLLTITNGVGGRFKDTTFTTNFTNGDFDNWRVYSQGGNIYFKILSSIKSGTTLKLVLMNGDATYLNGIDELFISPPAEEIEILCSSDISYGTELSNFNFLFKINEKLAKIPLLVINNPTLYNIRYRYKSHNNYSEIYDLISDSIGYYSEIEHYDDGNLIPGSIQDTPYSVLSYNQGFIPLILSSTAYSIFNLGDIPGIVITSITNVTTLIDLEVGISKQYQVFLASLPVTLGSNLIINIKSNSFNKNGNKFFLNFLGNINLGGNSIQIRQNYINPGSPGTLLKTISSQAELNYRQYAVNDLIWINFLHNGTSWLNINEDNFNRVYTNYQNIATNTSDIAFVNANWVDQILVDGDLTAGAGEAFHITSQKMRYKVIGKSLIWKIYIEFTITLGTPNFVYIPIPGGYNIDILNLEAFSCLYGDSNTPLPSRELGMIYGNTATKKSFLKADQSIFSGTINFAGQIILNIL